jgi:allantoicase
MADFRELPDLALRSVGGAVVYANDDAFAAKENLITPGRPAFDPTTFGSQGKVYDGWETRRRRSPGHDEAIVRLGVSGVVHGVVVDTAWFKGNYPPEIAVDGARADGLVDVTGLEWEPLVPRSAVSGDSENAFAVENPRRVTHIRLRIFPDGGVARLRVHGEALPDPDLLEALGTADLAALENGGRVVACSNAFYGSPNNLLLPGPARTMGEGWENARRRDDGHDWALFRLAGAGTVRHVELDTSYFLGNAPGWVRLAGCRVASDDGLGSAEWFDLLPRERSQPDTRQRFAVEEDRPVTHVRLDVYPDGGMARLRVWGELVDPPAGDVSGRRPARSAPGR